MMRKRQSAVISGAKEMMLPIRTRTPSASTMMPALCRAMKARKPPIPAAMDFFSASGMALISHSRMRNRLTMIKSTPEKKTQASAVCQVWPSCMTTV